MCGIDGFNRGVSEAHPQELRERYLVNIRKSGRIIMCVSAFLAGIHNYIARFLGCNFLGKYSMAMAKCMLVLFWQV